MSLPVTPSEYSSVILAFTLTLWLGLVCFKAFKSYRPTLSFYYFNDKKDLFWTIRNPSKSNRLLRIYFIICIIIILTMLTFIKYIFPYKKPLIYIIIIPETLTTFMVILYVLRYFQIITLCKYKKIHLM